MKVKPITPLAILMALGTIGNVLAEEGRNSLEFTLTAFISGSAPPNNVNIKFYDHTGKKIQGPLNLDPLQSVTDNAGNLVFGSTGKFEGSRNKPEIKPKNIYVVEISSDDPELAYQRVGISSGVVKLNNDDDNANDVIDGRVGIISKGPKVLVFNGTPDNVPSELLSEISTPSYFDLLAGQSSSQYQTDVNAIKSNSVYLPVGFFAHLPNWGDNTSGYTQGAYQGTGYIDIEASW